MIRSDGRRRDVSGGASGPTRISRAAFWPGWPVIAAAGMGAGAAQVQAVDREPVAAAAEERPPQEELVERLLAVERMAAGQAVVALEVERRDHLAGADARGEPGREVVEHADDAVGEGVRPARRRPTSRRGARTARTGR